MAMPTLSDELKKQAIEAVEKAGGSVSKAAITLGVPEKTLRNRYNKALADQALKGYAPEHGMVHTVPDPFIVKGVSTLYDADGNKKAQWVKSTLDQRRAEQAIREFIEHLTEGIKGKSPLVKPPKHADSDLLAVYPMGDPHFGMYAWADECGENFDLDIAESLTCGAIDRLVSSAPPAENALILQLGDFFHADNQSNMTPRSGNPLDVDTRWAQVMQVGMRAMVYIVQRALEKHKTVTVRNNEGNHDPHSAFALALALDAYFSNNKRVKVELSPAKFWFYRFGKVLIGTTHGDTCKMTDLPGVMAADRPEEWGLTKFRYWYQGHIHHEDRKEYAGVVVEAFRTLAAKDAYHAGHGYRAGRDMRLIVHHKDFGEIERHRCDVSMINAA